MNEIEDGMGFSGLAPTPQERAAERYQQTLDKVAAAREATIKRQSAEIVRLREENESLRASLDWCVPLASLALEDCRQQRLRSGHNDIGAGTDKVGLWPFEVNALETARMLARRSL